MKKKLIALFCLFSFLTSGYSQSSAKTDSILSSIDGSLIMVKMWTEHIDQEFSLKQRYKLYPTDNMYNFLQLDTKTGIIKQIQWSLKSEEELSVYVNPEDLTFGFGYGANSFELFPTQNMYQFLLLNKCTGDTWHVQWGMKSSERWIRKIH